MIGEALKKFQKPNTKFQESRIGFWFLEFGIYKMFLLLPQIIHSYRNLITSSHTVTQEIVRKVVFDRLRDRPSHLARSVFLREAFLCEEIDNRRLHRHSDAAFFHDPLDDLSEH